MSTTVAVADGIFNIVDAKPVLLGSRARQVPNDPKVADTHVYGAPRIIGATILSR